MNRQQRRRLRPSRKRRTIAGLSFLAVASVGSGYGQLLRSSIAYASTTCTVDNSTDSPGSNSPGQRTLRYCVGAVQADLSGGTINFSGVTLITLSSRLPSITKSTTISGGSGVTINGTGGHGFLYVDKGLGDAFAGETLTLEDLTVTGFTNLTGDEAVVYNWEGGGTLNIIDSTITANQGQYIVYFGEGNVNPEVNIINSTFSHNDGTDDDGPVRVVGDLTVTNSIFSHNESGKNGGAIVSDGSLTIVDSTFSFNTASSNGGAIYKEDTYGNVSISGSTFKNNTTGAGGYGSGGAIGIVGADDVQLSNLSFEGNLAEEKGGAAYIGALNTGLSISGSSFDTNAAVYGGGLYLRTQTTNLVWTLDSSTLIGNSSTKSGGALYVRGANGSGVVSNTFIGANSADDTGAAIFATPNSLGLNFTTISGNVSQSGPDFYAGAYTYVTMQASVISSSGVACAIDPRATMDDTFAVATDTSCGLSGADSVSSASVADLSLDDSTTQTVNGVTQTFQMPGADSILVIGAPTNDLGTGISLDQVGTQRTGRFDIGSKQFVIPPDPSPPVPTPTFPTSEPRAVQAVPGDRSAEVSWMPPQSSGSFPVTTYRAAASPGGRTCLAVAPALTCTVTGLTNGTPYTFTVSALNGAGWSPESALSNSVTPRAPQGKSIMIVGGRSVSDPVRVEVRGSTQGLEGEQVSPWIRFPGQTAYMEGRGIRSVDDRGKFTWGRKTGKKIHVYFTSGETKSNRISIPAK